MNDTIQDVGCAPSLQPAPEPHPMWFDQFDQFDEDENAWLSDADFLTVEEALVDLTLESANLAVMPEVTHETICTARS